MFDTEGRSWDIFCDGYTWCSVPQTVM